MPEIKIIQASPSDAPALRQIRLEALQNAPEAFGSDYESNLQTDWAARIEGNSGAAGAIFLAYVGDAVHKEDALAGMMGIVRGSSSKTQHGATIWGVYVSPSFRKLGIANQLIQTCLDWAKVNSVEIVKLAVVSTNKAARQLYERNGFIVFGTEPKALKVAAKYYDELWMVREIGGDV